MVCGGPLDTPKFFFFVYVLVASYILQNKVFNLWEMSRSDDGWRLVAIVTVGVCYYLDL